MALTLIFLFKLHDIKLQLRIAACFEQLFANVLNIDFLIQRRGKVASNNRRVNINQTGLE